MAVRIPIVLEPVDQTLPLRRSREPVTFGVPMPAGTVLSGDRISLIDEAGASSPVQTRVLERWLDGSVRWLLVDAQVTTDAQGRATCWLVTPAASETEAAPRGIRREATDAGLVLDSGAAVFAVSRGAGPLFEVTRDGRAMTEAGAELIVHDGEGVRWPVVVDDVVVEEEGPLRTTLRLDGAARRGQQALIDIVVRLTCFAASATARVSVTVRNRRRATHGGGYWELGDAGSVYLRELSFTASLSGSDPVTTHCSPEPGEPWSPGPARLTIHQASSGGALWQSPVHVDRHGLVPLPFRGYRIRADGRDREWLRATPIVSMDAGDRTLAVAMPQFWQNFPKGIVADDRRLSLQLFPPGTDHPAELQGGEQKTHSFFVAFGHDTVTAVPLDWCRSPLAARAEPSWYAASQALPFLTPADSDGSPAYLGLVQAGLDGPSSFERKREAIDEYGWRHFGDIYADHEAVGHEGPLPLVSHYNNQYDAVAGFARWFFRSGDLRWWQLMQDQSAHVVDIDIYHTRDDKAAYNGGMFWHTYHYRDAGRATHRSYPRNAPGVPGGGPSAEHSYATGLLLDYLLTGNHASREAVVGLGEWILSAEDGALTPFRWLSRAPTGLATSSGSPLYHGPGRGGANAIGVLLDAHRLTGDARYLDAAESFIRRSVHPRQAIDALTLLDAERRWYYTMFLQSLGRYLAHQQERGTVDAMFAYARESLLHFARWMAEHERPYLDHPEILEYPNETWAAQDMRKADVFCWAARYAPADERERFLERADFFFEYSVSTLTSMPTRSLARPMVLLLGNGAGRDWFRQSTAGAGIPDPPAAPPWPSRWQPTTFVPQKTIAMRRLKAMVVAAAVACAALLAGVLLSLL